MQTEREEPTEMVKKAIIREAGSTSGENSDVDARNREGFLISRRD